MFFRIRWGVKLSEGTVLHDLSCLTQWIQNVSLKHVGTNERSIRKGGGREVLLVLPWFYIITFYPGNWEWRKVFVIWFTVLIRTWSFPKYEAGITAVSRLFILFETLFPCTLCSMRHAANTQFWTLYCGCSGRVWSNGGSFHAFWHQLWSSRWQVRWRQCVTTQSGNLRVSWSSTGSAAVGWTID